VWRWEENRYGEGLSPTRDGVWAGRL